MSAHLTCILCPRGCRLRVSDQNDLHEVTGAGCRRGIVYAQEEITHPVRMVTSTVALEDTDLKRLPVKTAAPVPRDMVFPVVEALRKVRISAPVAAGDTVLKDAAGTGIAVIAARSVSRKEGAG